MNARPGIRPPAAGGLSRRSFGRLAGAAALSLAAPAVARGAGKPRVVVIGGGPGGATAARYVASGAGDAVDVTLVTAEPRYTTCFYSNLYLGGLVGFDDITHGYEALARGGSIRVVHAMADAVDRDAKTVVTAGGDRIAYDRLVISPGIRLVWDSVEGYSEEAAEIMPHAWIAGRQTQLLKTRLDAIENGQQIVIVPPPNPYRCPPGPYERASMMAHALKSRGLTDCRIVILDPKEKFSKQGLFQEGWEQHYPGMIEWYGPTVHGGIAGVDPAAGTVTTDFDTFSGALVNVIPAQRAGLLAERAGLTDESGFCPTDADSMRSTLDSDVFVLGDAAIAGDMPKSAFAANAQAKVAAMALVADLADGQRFPARYANTCWSLITPEDGVKVGAVYAPEGGRIATAFGFVSHDDEAPEIRAANAREVRDWYAAFTADVFGG